VAFSRDGQRILGQDVGGKLLVWSATTGQLVSEPSAPTRPATAKREATSPDGRLRAHIQGRLIRVMEVTDFERSRQRDRERLRRLARFDPVWHRQQALDAEDDGDTFAASFHVEQLLQAQPWDASLHAWQAHALARLNRREEASKHLMHARFLNPRVSLWPSDPDAATRAGNAARAGDWPRAARVFERAVHQPSSPDWRLANLLLAQAAAGDEAGRRRTVAEMSRRVSATTDANTRHALLYYALIVPSDADTAGRLLACTSADLARQRNALALYKQGAALYRAGRYAEAERTLAESVRAQGKSGFVETCLFQALVAHQHGQHDQARALLARFTTMTEKLRSVENNNWQQRVGCQLLLDETRAVVNALPPMRRVADGE
jgi:tetratricopeptide (TPR) repeat protein